LTAAERARENPGPNTDEEGRHVIARIATFEGGDAEEMGRRNNEILVERATELPAGILRVMVLMNDESRWSVISFFDNEETASAAEERFEKMGDEIPESVRGKRVTLETFEVAFDVEMVR
jgi:UV DNA damage repair endonuclease